MRSVRAILVVLLAVAGAVLLGPASTACACSCAPRDPTQQLADADAVFVGVVTDLDRPWPILSSTTAVTATIDVTLVHKGSLTSTVHVSTEAEGASCGYSFATGHRYLVFVRALDGGQLRTGLCDGNLDLATDQDPFTDGHSPLPNPPNRSWTWWWIAAAGVAAVAPLVVVLARRRSRRTQNSA